VRTIDAGGRPARQRNGDTGNGRPDSNGHGSSGHRNDLVVPPPASERARLALALAAGKVAGTAAQALKLGGGTSVSGAVARHIDPEILQKVATASDASKLVVTGSNGKTTTCRMIAALSEVSGLRVLQNRAGSNLLQGVISAAVRGTDLQGRLDAQVLLLEVDEGAVRRVISAVQPDVFLITNIFRDQLDRFGELYSMARALESAIEALPPSSTVVLNGDDPLVASLAPDAPARRLYFGIQGSVGDTSEPHACGGQVPEHSADTIRCVRCQHPLTYKAVHMSHLGEYWCPECGAERPRLDVAVTSAMASAEGQGFDITVDTPAGAFPLQVPLPGVHNVYNAAAALACTLPTSASPAPDDARRAIAGLRPAFGRLETIHADGREVILAFVKNPTSYNTSLRTVLQRTARQYPPRTHVLAAHSNTVVDGQDFAWLWDVDLEQLVPQLASLTISGTRAEEVALRFKYAGADPAAMRVVPDRAAALQTALAATPPGESLHIFAGYTPMRELRSVMQRHSWVPPFWEE
jgi:lipid II isoglutaminyl synthase (glutamine-hydrolysing)